MARKKKKINVDVVEADNQTRDYQKFFVEKGEAGFNPDYNKFVIENTIKKTNALRIKKMKQFRDAIGERVDAALDYCYSMKNRSMPVEKYFGKKWMAYLRGEEIADKLRSQVSGGLIGKAKRGGGTIIKSTRL